MTSVFLGTAALVVYFSAPYWLMRLPPPNATVAQVAEFGARYHDVILWDTWFQAIGSLLSIVFVLALVQLAGSAQRFAGRLTLLASAVVLVLGLMEGMLALGALQAGANGHPQAALGFLDLINAFTHVFLLAPSLFLALGAALWGTRLLPPIFSYLAVALGIAFQILGFAGLFSSAAVLAVSFILMAQNLWTIAAAIALVAGSDERTEARAGHVSLPHPPLRRNLEASVRQHLPLGFVTMAADHHERFGAARPGNRASTFE